MNIALCYVLPCLNQPKYGPAARLFADTYMSHPPGQTDHRLYVILNGSTGVGPYQRSLFNPLPVEYLEHNNWGRDIGAFQMAADQLDCDLLVCLGAHVHFNRAGWLDRMVSVFEDNGPAVYGAWGFQVPLPHLRTTAFWMPRDLLRLYPNVIGDNHRYGFEHGQDSISLWSQRMGFEPQMVTWQGCYGMADWHPIPNDQALCLDQHADPR